MKDQAPPPAGLSEEWLQTLAGADQETPPETLDELPVVDVGHYRIIDELAKGGMGRIIVAEDRRLRRLVALKELLAPSGALAKRFADEAFITAQLQHPSIVPIHEAGRWPTGAPFYAMKLIAGRPLSELIRESKGLAARLALVKHVTAVAEAIAYAHKRRVIHRDIKPANVVVGSFGETMVIDWGLAKNLARRDEGAGGAIVGTPAFMPPEQASGGDVDERADVFALGAMLYTVLSGRPPYEQTDTEQAIRAILAGPPPLLRDLVPECPEDLLAIADKAMARRPADRYPSALELAHDLERFLEGRLVTAHTYSTWTLMRRWFARHRISVSVAAAGLVALAAVGGVSVRRVIDERDRADRERARAHELRMVAERAHHREAARVQQLTLAHAELGLEHDPSMTIAWLESIDPATGSGGRARQLAAEAHALGVASHLIVAGDGGVTAVALSPDGKRAATGGRNGHVRTWDISGPDPVLGGDETLGGAIQRVFFLANGQVVACDGNEEAVFPFPSHSDETGPVGAATDVDVTADGRWLAVASDGEVSLWSVSPTRRTVVVKADGEPQRLAVAPGGAAVAWRDHSGMRLFVVETSEVIDLAGAPAGEGSIVFSRDGHLLAAGGDDVAVVWNARTGGLVRRLADESSMRFLAFSPVDDGLASSGADASVTLWDLATGEGRSLSQWSSSSSRVTLFSPDGRLVVATRDESARVIDLASGEYRKLRGLSRPVTSAAFAADSRRLIIAGLDGTARVFDVSAGLARTLRAPAGSAAAFRNVSAAAGDVVSLGDANGACGDAPYSPDGTLLTRSGDGRSLAFTAAGGRVVVCDREHAALRSTWTGDAPTALSLSADGSVALIGFPGGNLQRRRLTDSTSDSSRIEGDVAAIASSSDGRVVAALTSDHRLWIWSAGANPAPVAAGVELFALSLDGLTAVTLDAAHETLALRDTRTGGVTGELPGRSVTALALTARGEIVVGTQDGTVTVSDRDQGSRTLTTDGASILALDVSPSGDAIAALDAKGTAHIFTDDVPTDPAAFRAWLEGLTNATIDTANHLAPRR